MKRGEWWMIEWCAHALVMVCVCGDDTACAYISGSDGVYVVTILCACDDDDDDTFMVMVVCMSPDRVRSVCDAGAKRFNKINAQVQALAKVDSSVQNIAATFKYSIADCPQGVRSCEDCSRRVLKF